MVYMRSVVLVYFFYCLCLVQGDDKADSSSQKEHFVFWPNGTIPFYIYPTHFDKEQSLAIMSSLSYFAFKTCLQFRPVIVEPQQNQHVMVFENPRGVRKCSIGMEGHGREELHRITLGYECLKSPNIDMMVMKALGFPFEHNRASRDVFIDVQFENIESGFIPLFTKEKILPPELRALPYDINSVMHFGEREYSNNGHRTIIFKNGNTKQHRVGLSTSDLRKIEIVYGPECQKRDRQAKIDICKNYPTSRRKREVNLTVRSLRVNREITAPPDNLTDELTQSLNDLGIENEVQNLIEQIHKITAVALETARTKHCNTTNIKEIIKTTKYNPNYDITKIVEVVRDYTKSIIDEVGSNLTIFCEDRIDFVPDIRCGWGKENCPVTYKSTKTGGVMYSTQHRPIIKQSTKPQIHKPRHFELLRSNNTEEGKGKDVTDRDGANKERRKRDVTDKVVTEKDATDKDVIISNVTEDVRTEATVENKKVVNFAPVRRFGEGIFSFFDTKTKSEDKGDASNISIERSKKHVVSHRESERPKQKYRERLKDRHRDEERNINSQEDRKKEVERRPKLKKQKERHRKRTNVPEIVELSKENKEFYAERVWPDGIVRYVIEDDYKYDIQDVRDRLEEVNNILKRKTCVRIEEVSEEEARKYDYLVLDTSPFYVTGRVGGRQNFGCMELFEGGQHRQHAAMVVMAMLGFYFEVSRHDRDKYVRVHMRHIRADKLHYFEKIRSDATLPVEYDYKSATHPPWQFWRKVGKKGISSVATYKDQDPDGSIMKSLGQNKQLLSDTDIIKINSVYGVKCFQNQRRAKIKHF